MTHATQAFADAEVKRPQDYQKEVYQARITIARASHHIRGMAWIGNDLIELVERAEVRSVMPQTGSYSAKFFVELSNRREHEFDWALYTLAFKFGVYERFKNFLPKASIDGHVLENDNRMIRFGMLGAAVTERWGSFVHALDYPMRDHNDPRPKQ